MNNQTSSFDSEQRQAKSKKFARPWAHGVPDHATWFCFSLLIPSGSFRPDLSDYLLWCQNICSLQYLFRFRLSSKVPPKMILKLTKKRSCRLQLVSSSFFHKYVHSCFLEHPNLRTLQVIQNCWPE